jgi:hypothetical protein
MQDIKLIAIYSRNLEEDKQLRYITNSLSCLDIYKFNILQDKVLVVFSESEHSNIIFQIYAILILRELIKSLDS